MSIAAEKDIVGEIVTIFRTDPTAAEDKIEKYLASNLPEHERLVALTALINEFNTVVEVGVPDDVASSDLCSAILGSAGVTGNLDPAVANQRLIASMQTVVKSLGELIDGLNVSMNIDSGKVKTVQEVLASSIESPAGETELASYLDQIRLAYASMYEGFKLVTSAQMKKLLSELSPEKMAVGVKGKLNVGPFKKAQIFDVYCEKHQNLSSYIDRNIFMESLLHKFESESQRVFLKKRWNND